MSHDHAKEIRINEQPIRDVGFEKPPSKEIRSMLDEMDGDRATTEMTSRIGTIKLEDGRLAQIHIIITTEVNDFLELT